MTIIKKIWKQNVLSITTALFLIGACSNIDYQDKRSKRIRIIKKEIHTPDDIFRIKDSLVIPYIYTNVVSLNDLPVTEKKQKFFDLLLPAILVAKTNLDMQRNWVITLNKKENISSSDSIYIQSLLDKFKSKSISELVRRMHTFPISIILAQAANESGWGSSRFFIKANNPFGIWSFDSHQNRIPASKTRNGKTIYLRKFNNLEEAIDAYYIMLATRKIFAPFHEASLNTNDPYILIKSLNNYSERGSAYVNDLYNIISSNHLHKYDTYKIDSSFILTVKQD